MKKITLKLIAFLLFAATAMQVSAQAWTPENQPGLYRVQVQGENLALTVADEAVDGAWSLTYEAIDENNNGQVFIISPAEIAAEDGSLLPNMFTFFSAVDGRGLMEIADNQNDSSPVVCRGEENFDPEKRLNVWNPSRGQGTQIFSQHNDPDASFAGKARRRLQNFAEGDLVKISGGSPVPFDFVPVESLSTANLLTSSDFSIKSLSSELVISSNVANMSQISVYNILGKNVLTESAISSSEVIMNTSSLATGMYIVKIATDKGIFSTKIVK